MTNYHVNTETGEVGKCSAKIQCRFASEDNVEHFNNKDEAFAKVEKVLSEKYGQFNGKKKEEFSVNKYNYSGYGIPKPEYSSAELAFTITDLDRDKTDYDYVLQSDLMAFEDRIDVIKNPDNKDLKEMLRQKIERNVSSSEYDQKLYEMSVNNYPLKADIAGVSIAREYEQEISKNWNDDNSIFGKKATEERLEEIQKEIKEYEETGQLNGKDVITDDDKNDVVLKYYSENQLKETLNSNGLSNPFLVSYSAKNANKKVSERLRKPDLVDYTNAAQNTLDYYAEKPGYSWNDLQGAETLKNTETISEYRHKIQTLASKDKKDPYNKKFNENIEKEVNANFFARKYNEGVVVNNTQKIDQAFEKEWNNGGEQVAKSRLKKAKKNQANFKADVIDQGGLDAGDNRRIKELLDKDVAEAEKNIKTRGRADREILGYFRETGVIGQYYKI